MKNGQISDNIIVQAIPALNDNYIWAIIDKETQQTVMIDPGEAEPVFEFLKDHQLSLCAILLTHHHWDHCNGALALKERFNIPVFCSKIDKITAADQFLSDNDVVDIAGFPLHFKTIAIPGHTSGHIAYYASGQLFCGDTLFASGCGRIFEGTPEEMLHSLQKLASLPDSTKVFCGHEYTLKNLEFACLVEPENTATAQRLKEIRLLRQHNLVTLPTFIGLEKKYNPFLRCHIAAVKSSVETYASMKLSQAVDVFRELRKWKDTF